MTTLAETSTCRLEKILFNDKKQNPNQILPLLKSELFSLLQNYLNVKDLIAKFEIQNGEYVLKFEARASHIKQIGLIH